MSSFNSIVSGLSKMVKSLEAHAESLDKKLDNGRIKIDQIRQKQHERSCELIKSEACAKKIREIIG